ncbi:hypothetical protein K469DRAFT_751427 [Zopfia rhizophila CBS 207.26]|uniref:Uncharacterized protein n=1 Tax=Zopfia rhizophila CBS 207.26 TaxID=1314779 RepID=A0A6A6DXG2_9PEZI|nr:hypothetical protein K469DRAFT_751427 [Zopfia rhizophila CBS 207.26]
MTKAMTSARMARSVEYISAGKASVLVVPSGHATIISPRKFGALIFNLYFSPSIITPSTGPSDTLWPLKMISGSPGLRICELLTMILPSGRNDSNVSIDTYGLLRRTWVTDEDYTRTRGINEHRLACDRGYWNQTGLPGNNKRATCWGDEYGSARYHDRSPPALIVRPSLEPGSPIMTVPGSGALEGSGPAGGSVISGTAELNFTGTSNVVEARKDAGPNAIGGP